MKKLMLCSTILLSISSLTTAKLAMASTPLAMPAKISANTIAPFLQKAMPALVNIQACVKL
jgi:hypothetical protein